MIPYQCLIQITCFARNPSFPNVIVHVVMKLDKSSMRIHLSTAITTNNVVPSLMRPRIKCQIVTIKRAKVWFCACRIMVATCHTLRDVDPVYNFGVCVHIW